MSKYRPLWEYSARSEEFPIILGFDEIRDILGFPIDHSFLNCKKEAAEFGLAVGKISIKGKTVVIDKI